MTRGEGLRNPKQYQNSKFKNQNDTSKRKNYTDSNAKAQMTNKGQSPNNKEK